MLSPADMLVIGAAALLFFGPDQLPKVARRAGQVVRDVQATSASFIREMERAADEPEPYRAPASGSYSGEPYLAEPYSAEPRAPEPQASEPPVSDPYKPEPYRPDPELVPLDPIISTTHSKPAAIGPEPVPFSAPSEVEPASTVRPSEEGSVHRHTPPSAVEPPV